jgi:heparosan-N-sulfate-glucuronate 5-epimerase
MKHSEESKEITLKISTVSLDTELGSYYIDMRPAEIHYTQNIYAGEFNTDGVPMSGRQGKLHYAPVNIAQYGFILHAQFLQNGDEDKRIALQKCVEKLVEIAEITAVHCVWWDYTDGSRYKTKAPWASAMTQGEAISLFLRYYQISKDEIYLELAEKAYCFMTIPVSEGGVRRVDENGDLWLEEYPSEPASYVLNGFIYALLGLYDLYRVTKNEEVKKDIDLCVKTLENNLSKFDAGYWSYYDLQYKELVRYYYQKNVHVPQMAVMYQLTGKPIFLKYQNKWNRNIGKINFLFVQLMYRILPRWQAKSFFLK